MVEMMMNKMTWREMSQARQQGFTGTGTGTSPARQSHDWMLQSGTGTGRFRGTGRRLGRVGKRHGRMNHGHVGAGIAARQQAAQQAGICPSGCSTSVNPWTNVTTCNCASGSFSIYVIPTSTAPGRSAQRIINQIPAPVGSESWCQTVKGAAGKATGKLKESLLNVYNQCVTAKLPSAGARPSWREMKQAQQVQSQHAALVNAVRAQVPEQRAWGCVVACTGGSISKIGACRRACIAKRRRRRPSRRSRSAFRRR